MTVYRFLIKRTAPCARSTWSLLLPAAGGSGSWAAFLAEALPEYGLEKVGKRRPFSKTAEVSKIEVEAAEIGRRFELVA